MTASAVLPLPSYYTEVNEKLRLEGALSQDSSTRTCKTPLRFPEKLNGPLVWSKESMQKYEDSWIVQLNAREANAIETALRLLQGVFYSLIIEEC